MSFVESAYQKVTGPLPVVGSALDLANDYRKLGKDIPLCVDNLIRWQCSKTALSGFVTNLGGILTMPVGIPADLAQSIYVQLRMIAAIAHMYEYNVHSDNVRTICIACLCGGSTIDILSNVGIKVGQNVAKNIIKSIPGKVLIEINKKVGFRLFTKFGTTGVINLGKCIPFVGAGIGSIMNLTYTYSIGKAAKSIFGGVDDNLTAAMPKPDNVPHLLEEDYFIDRCGPKIFKLQLEMKKEEVDTVLQNLAKRYNLKCNLSLERYELISDTNEVYVTASFDTDRDILSAFSLCPKIFRVSNFHSPKFIDKFLKYYQVPDFFQDEDENTVILKYINDDEKYEIALQNHLLEVKLCQKDDEPYFVNFCYDILKEQ